MLKLMIIVIVVNGILVVSKSVLIEAIKNRRKKKNVKYMKEHFPDYKEK